MKIIKLSAIDSTNSYLKSLSKDIVVEDGTIVVTRNQEKGRGQMGAYWRSVPSQSLTFSLFKTYKDLSIERQFYVLFAVAIGVKNGLNKCQIPDVKIKWPNDILAGGKKVCGILIENQLTGNKIDSSIVGVGLNVNETEFPDLPQASSLKMLSGRQFDLDEVLATVSETIFEILKSSNFKDPTDLKREYEKYLFRRDEVSAFEKPSGERFNGIIKEVSTNGKLIIEIEDESLQKYELKQIKLLY